MRHAAALALVALIFLAAAVLMLTISRRATRNAMDMPASPADEIMKPSFRHAAELVKWCLMVPPVSEHSPDADEVVGGFEDDLSPDLLEWQIRDSFDSAATCHKARDKLASQLPKAKEDHLEKTFREAESCAQCIPSDDPRLKAGHWIAFDYFGNKDNPCGKQSL